MSILGDLVDKAQDALEDVKENVETSDIVDAAKDIVSGEGSLKDRVIEEAKELADKAMNGDKEETEAETPTA
jgi:endonuclease IV